MKILIVEDQKLEFRQLEFFLEEHGYTVGKYTDSFNAAIQQLNEFEPDLVLIDIELKGERNGIALALEINKNYQIPFIFTSIIEDNVVIDIALELADFIHKPFLEKQVLSAIKRVLRKGQDWSSPIKQILWLSKIDQNNHLQGSPRFPVNLGDIEWIESANKIKNNTIRIKTCHCPQNKPGYEMRKTIKEIYSQLPSTFIQTSDAHIVNEEKITKFVPILSKKKGFVFIGTKKISVSSNHIQKLNQRFRS